jgi:hypothetical protein
MAMRHKCERLHYTADEKIQFVMTRCQLHVSDPRCPTAKSRFRWNCAAILKSVTGECAIWRKPSETGELGRVVQKPDQSKLCNIQHNFCQLVICSICLMWYTTSLHCSVLMLLMWCWVGGQFFTWQWNQKMAISKAHRADTAAGNNRIR